MKEGEVKERVDSYLNQSFDGRYRTSIDVEDDGVILSIAFEDGSEKPLVGHAVDIMVAELGLENFRIHADWEPERNRYIVEIKSG
ncbi:MAG: hypothetical protein ABEK10_03565 [Candidatus Nanosalina sp.]